MKKIERAETDLKEKIDSLLDSKVYGDPDSFKLIYKVTSETGKFAQSIQAMEIEDLGCLVVTRTMEAGIVTESSTFVPEVIIEDIGKGAKGGRKLARF